ncbi:hypothetical protein WA158_007728 [Blastocystis sp. Blastoise]
MLSQKLKIALVVFSYFVVSISMVFVNKYLITGENTSIPAPFFVTWYQCVITVIICWLLGLLGRGKPKQSFLGQFPVQRYDLATGLRILPLSTIFVCMITFNNLCLKYVDVSFYLIARSLTIVFNVLFTFFFLHTTTSFPVICSLCVVIFGFFIGNDGQMVFSLWGTVFGVLSSVFVSLNSIYTKKLIYVVDNDSWKLCFYNNMNACVLFIPFIFYFEYDIIMSHIHVLQSSTFWFWMSFAGIVGFLIGIVTILQIKLTSPLTHNISGTAKACVQSICAVIFRGETMGLKMIIGSASVLTGSFLYSYIRSVEMDKATKLAKVSSLSVEQPSDIEKDEITESKPLLTEQNKNQM